MSLMFILHAFRREKILAWISCFLFSFLFFFQYRVSYGSLDYFFVTIMLMILSKFSDMSSTAFIEPLPVIEFVTQLLNRDVTSRPLSDSDRVKVRLSCFYLDHCYSLDRTLKSVWYFIFLQLCCFSLLLMLGFPFRESGQVNWYLINLLLLFFKSLEYLMQFLCDELCC